VVVVQLGIVRVLLVGGHRNSTLYGNRSCIYKPFLFRKHATEYGVHWDFFLTLAILDPIVKCMHVSLLVRLLDRRP
jgi:hypothetical protein